MRARTVARVALAVCAVSGLSGCILSDSEIADEQLDRWRVKGQEMIPAATEITFETDQLVNMFGGGSNFLRIEVAFANFADLKDSAMVVDDFGAAIEQASGAQVDTRLANAGAQEFDAGVASRLVDQVSAVDGAFVETDAWFYTNSGVPQLTATAYVYVTDEEVVDPAWLDAVVGTTQQAVDEEGGGSISGISIYPAEILEEGSAGSHLGRYRFEVWALPGIRNVAESTYCVRTDSWAYDVSERSASVYPASEPGGACAPATEEG